MVTSSARPSPTTSAATRSTSRPWSSAMLSGDVEALDGHADLPAGDEGGVARGRQGGVDLDVGGQEGGVVSPELEDDRRVGAGAGHDGPAGGDAAGERDHVHVGVGDQGLTQCGAGAVDGVSTPAEAPRPWPPPPAGRPRAGRRGLHHHRVPGQQGGQDLVAEHRDGPVERQDGGHHAVGHLLDPGRPGVVDPAGQASATKGAKAPAMPPMVPASNWASQRPCRARG